VKVIATPASTPAALAAKAATATIPIVFATGADPVAIGLVGSLNHPGGNVTGMGFETVEITGKAFEVLHELLPKEAHITLLMYPNSVFSAPVKNKIQASAAALGVRFDMLEAGSDSEIEDAFAKVGQRSAAPRCSVLTRFIPAIASKLFRSQHATGCPSCISRANSPKLAD
jgi:putative ABC transport system substrate-binding protein